MPSNSLDSFLCCSVSTCCKQCVGGHTAEMMSLLGGLDTEAYSPRCYVVAESDKMSGQKAEVFEQQLSTPSQQNEENMKLANQVESDLVEPFNGLSSRRAAQPVEHKLPKKWESVIGTVGRAKRAGEPVPLGSRSSSRKSALGQAKGEAGSRLGVPTYTIARIPRSREVGQSFLTSVATTLFALGAAVKCVLAFRPDVVLVNGPGTCIPICAAAVLARVVGVARGRVVYVESIARVYRLSLSGKILYHTRLADRFFVQWPDLCNRYPRCTYAGRVM